jgi:hypothetical protein
MHIKQRIYASLSATLVAALFTFLCCGQLSAEEHASPEEAPQHFTTPAQEEGSASQDAPANPEHEAEQTAGPHPGVDIVLPEGKVEAVLAADMTARSEPLSPSREFSEDAKQIYLVLTSALPEAASIQTKWIAVSVEGILPNHKLADSRIELARGQRGIITIKASQEGFSPGDYQIELAVNGGPAQSLPFTVVPLFPPVLLAEQTKVPRGFNIALAALGGKVEGTTSEYDDKTWSAANLIDGAVSISEGGWSSKYGTSPQDLLFSFYPRWTTMIENDDGGMPDA